MRFLVACMFAGLLALPLRTKAQVDQEGTIPEPTNGALFVHGRGFLPPQLMLRASYYLYLDADADNGATSDQTEPKAEEPKSAQADGEVATSDPAPGTEVPDIDTLSQRAIEHYEIQSEEKEKYERRRRRARRIGVPIAVAAVVAVVVVGAVGASYASSDFD
jgi:hypothetical protein